MKPKELTIFSLMFSFFLAAKFLTWISPTGDPIGIGSLIIALFIPLIQFRYILIMILFHNLMLIRLFFLGYPALMGVMESLIHVDSLFGDSYFTMESGNLILIFLYFYYGVFSFFIWYFVFDKIGVYRRIKNITEEKTFYGARV